VRGNISTTRATVLLVRAHTAAKNTVSNHSLRTAPSIQLFLWCKNGNGDAHTAGGKNKGCLAQPIYATGILCVPVAFTKSTTVTPSLALIALLPRTRRLPLNCTNEVDGTERWNRPVSSM